MKLAVWYKGNKHGITLIAETYHQLIDKTLVYKNITKLTTTTKFPTVKLYNYNIRKRQTSARVKRISRLSYF